MHTPSHLGPLTELTLGFRASFPGDRWHPHRVEVTDEGTGLLYIFFCQEWLGDDNQNSMKLKVKGSCKGCAMPCVIAIKQPPTCVMTSGTC